MTKKKITPTLIAVLLVALGVAAACGKDAPIAEPVATTSTTHAAKSASSSLQRRLVSALYTCWRQSDSAFQANAPLFLSTCADENISNFLRITNLGYEFKSYVDTLLLNGTPSVTLRESDIDTTCIPCLIGGGLRGYAENIQDIRAILNAMPDSVVVDSLPLFMPPVSDTCLARCKYFRNFLNYGDEIFLCWLHCTSEAAAKKTYEYALSKYPGIAIP